MCKVLNLATIIASQTNSQGVSATVVTEQMVSESFAKAKKVAILITISSQGWMYIAKNRTGGPAHLAFPVQIDYSRSKFNLLGEPVTKYRAEETGRFTPTDEEDFYEDKYDDDDD